MKGKTPAERALEILSQYDFSEMEKALDNFKKNVMSIKFKAPTIKVKTEETK
jgi:hypothetical protein